MDGWMDGWIVLHVHPPVVVMVVVFLDSCFFDTDARIRGVGRGTLAGFFGKK